jgi:tyrosyl-tRNA synthetase
MSVNTNEETIDAFLARCVENVFPSREFLKARMAEGKPLSMYVGVDPTGPSLHMGHAIWLRKLARWQDMGHKAVMLIGDFTAMIGDPTDKGATRKQLTREQVLENCRTYKEQASKFLRFEGENAAELRFNSEWLSKMNLGDVLNLASHFTVQQMMERDLFQKRLRWDVACENCGKVSRSPITFASVQNFSSGKINGKFQCSHCKRMAPLDNDHIFPSSEMAPVYLHEFMYPLMQGYDSVAMDVDGEMGGNDQTFNMLAGRTLMKEMASKEKFVIAYKLLADASGKKMGKSEGNVIAFHDSPDELFGKVMSWTDGMIVNGFELCTDLPMDEVARISKSLAKDETNPRDVKARLAKEIVKVFHGDAQAEAAASRFDSLFRDKKGPDEEQMVEVKVDAAPARLLEVLVAAGFVQSKGDGRRQIEQGGVKVDGEVVRDLNATVAPGSVIQKGPRHFARVTK